MANIFCLLSVENSIKSVVKRAIAEFIHDL